MIKKLSLNLYKKGNFDRKDLWSYITNGYCTHAFINRYFLSTIFYAVIFSNK